MGKSEAEAFQVYYAIFNDVDNDSEWLKNLQRGNDGISADSRSDLVDDR